MEKPRKKRYRDKSDLFGCVQIDCYNDGIDKMSTWLEGEVPTEKDIYKEMQPFFDSVFTRQSCARAIHALITRKLTGKV